MLRIAVLTDDRLFAAGLLHILASDPGVAVSEYPPGSAGSPRPATDVLLLDSRMEGALDVCASLKREGGPAVIFIAAPDDDGWAPDALAAGARGILPRSAGAEDLGKAVRVVHEGLIWARRRVIVAWLDRLTALSAPSRQRGNDVLEGQLSTRERDVFRHAAAGLGNREVAHRLAISQATVKVHLTRIFQKLGVRTRGELAAAYHGVVAPPRESARRPSPVVAASRSSSRAPLPLRRSS